MLKIFAKHGTSEKALVCCDRNEVLKIQHLLSDKLGGNWVWVDKLHRGNHEVLTFDDGMVYLGCDGVTERYSNAIKPLL